MKNVLFALIACAVAALPIRGWCQTPPATSASQTAMIDKQIKDLKNERDGAKMRALIAGRDADRFMTQDWLAYRRALARQDYFDEQVRMLDQKIAELEKQKALLEGKK